MNTFKFVVSSPNGNIFDDTVRSVSLRGANGDLAILAGHMPFVTSVIPSQCTITFDDATIKTGETKGGLLSVEKEQTTLITSDFKFV